MKISNTYNPDKCETMRIKSNLKKVSVKNFYNLDDVRLNIVRSEEDLGIIFDQTLSFAEHIFKKVKKANSLTGMLRRSFVHLDKVTFKLLFTSIVRPHLEYGAPVWNPHQKKLINLIENVQRRASRLIPGMSHLTYKERLLLLKLPTLQYRRYRGDMIEMFKIAHNLYDYSAINDFIKFQPNTKNLRRHNFTIYKEKCNKDVRKYSFKCRVTDQWNNLPTEIVNSPTLNTFKSRLDKLWARDEIMYDPTIDLYKVTSSRKSRYK